MEDDIAGNIWKSIFQTFNPFKKGLQDQLSIDREIDRGEIEVDSYYQMMPRNLRGGKPTEEENIFAVYLASLKISEYRDKIYDSYSAIRSNYLVQSILEIMSDDCLRPDKASGNIVNITSSNSEWNKELERLQDKIDFDAIISDITPEILLYGEYAQHLRFVKGEGIVDMEDVYDIKNILPIYKGGKIKEYLVKSDTSEQQGNMLLPETMGGVAFERSPLYKYVYFVRAGKRIRVKTIKPAYSSLTNQFEVDRVSGNVRIGRSVIPTSLIPLIKSLSTLETILPLVRILQLDKRSLVGIRFPGVTKLERVQNTVQEYERMINDTWRTANIATTGEFNVQDLIGSITKFRVIPLLGEKGCFTGDTEIAMYCGDKKIKIKDLVGLKQFIVYSYDLELNQIVPGRAFNCHVTKFDEPVMKVVLDSEKCIKCTYDHKFLMRDGNYKEAQELKAGESLMPLYYRTKESYRDFPGLVDSPRNTEEIYQPGRGWASTRDTLSELRNIVEHEKRNMSCENHKVIRIEPAGKEDVYDFTVENYHNFALSAGVFVHNSIEMQDIPTPEIGCFVAGTKILLQDGRKIPIEELMNEEEFYVYSYDIGNNLIVTGKGHSCHLTKNNAPVYEVELDNREKIECTGNHKFLMQKGWYASADNLQPGDPLMSLKIGVKVVSVKFVGYKDVYDFTVDIHHNFALSAGIFVHNSMDDFDYIKKTVFEGIGVPSAYVLGGEGKESLKTYVRYLKKLASIQRSLVVGLKHIATVHLRALGHKALPADINVEFANLVSVENLDELEYLDILTSLLRNYWEFVRDMDDIDGPTPGIVNWGEVMTFLYEKMKSFAGSEKFLEKNVAYFRKMGTLPIQTKVSAGVGGSAGGGGMDLGGGGEEAPGGETGFKIVPPEEAGKTAGGGEEAGAEYNMEEPTAITG